MGKGKNFAAYCHSEIQCVLSLISLNTKMASLVTRGFGHTALQDRSENQNNLGVFYGTQNNI